MLDERKLEVLRAIVEDYVATQEPVGSRALVTRHALGVSPATVRNDMVQLEEEGYIAQPHTSAGRVPTDKGYRLFVDRLSTIKPLSKGERQAIEKFLEGAVDVDDVMQRSVRLLAQLTNQVAVVQYPSLTRSTVRHLDIINLGSERVLLVLITSSGRVEQRTVETGLTLDDELISQLRQKLLSLTLGERLPTAAMNIAELANEFASEDRPIVAAIVAALAQTFSNERSDERLAVGGIDNLMRYGGEFESVIEPVLTALEEHVVLLRLLGEATQSKPVSVRIGKETGAETLSSTTMVAASYGDEETSYASLGTIGPMRMDYPGTISRVTAVARYVGQTISQS